MSLLDQWREKTSAKKSLPLYPVYIIKETGEKDIDMQTLLSKSKQLTLDLNSETGFQEISMDWLKSEIPDDKKYIIKPLPKNSNITITQYAKSLVRSMRNFLVEVWDPTKFHLVFMSGGKDSRIIGYILASLRDKKGRDWLGKIHIRCHEPETAIFKQVMKRQKWNENEYSVYREGEFTEPGYFENFYNFYQQDVNGYHTSPADFCHDLLEVIDPKNTQLITGSCGSEILDYPARQELKEIDRPFKKFKQWMTPAAQEFGRYYKR